MPAMTEDTLRDDVAASEWCQELQLRLNSDDKKGGTGFVVTLEPDAEHATNLVNIRQVEHSIDHNYMLNNEFFSSGEYRSIVELGKQLEDLITEGAKVSRGERSEEINSFAEAVDWLINEAKRGQSIQRYKGLGEMNPDQLWETTLNADSRRLMQVTIEDAVAADDLFTTLMGDQVEPRREFIESNALSVSNLDV